MKPKENLIDPSQGAGVYEGDLKYGRCLGTEPRNHRDYNAQRIKGVPTNKPVFCLPHVEKRDPDVWSKGGKKPKWNGNPPQIIDRIVARAMEFPDGLISCISVMKLGNSVMRSSK